MKLPGSYTKVVFIITVIIKLVSCTPESCLEETVAKVKIPLYLYSTKVIKAPDSLTVYGIPATSELLYNRAGSITRAKLPLNPAAESCTFVIRINGVSDTLIMNYELYPHLISKECGYSFYYTIDSLLFTENAIDSIAIRNRNVTTLDEENFRIFY